MVAVVARVLMPNRSQVELRPSDLESRQWKVAAENTDCTGNLFSLWLYATVEE
ncbi:MAG: hypothetical protein IPP22_04040 [Nitrosomonas sp.]|nr:hypothetical protein [Nitrosomonas sp.]